MVAQASFLIAEVIVLVQKQRFAIDVLLLHPKKVKAW